MSATPSVLSPNIPHVDYPDGMFNVMSDIVTTRIGSYPQSAGMSQDLTIGSTSNLVVESKSAINVHNDPSKNVNFYKTTESGDGTRTEQKYLQISSSNSVTELKAPSGEVRLSPNDSAKTTQVGNMTINENTSSQLINTNKADIKVMKNLSVIGDLSMTGQFYAPNLSSVNLIIDNNLNVVNQVSRGNTYGNNMNLWMNLPSTSDKSANQIGYGFRINSNNEQLELFKYKRYSYLDGQGQVQVRGKTQYRKVAQFGYGVTTYEKNSDIADTDVFSSLETIMTTSNVAASNGGSGTGGEFYWVRNSNVNIYYYGNVGVNQSYPQYAIDVTGSISASDTVISTNYATASDERIKTDITRLNTAVCLDTIRSLMPSTYNLRTVDNTYARKTGLIAQEVNNVVPEAVEIKANTAYELEDFHYLDYNVIIGYLIGAVKELDRKLTAVETATRQTSKFMNRSFT